MAVGVRTLEPMTSVGYVEQADHVVGKLVLSHQPIHILVLNKDTLTSNTNHFKSFKRIYSLTSSLQLYLQFHIFLTNCVNRKCNEVMHESKF